jgi:cyclin-dependent kinase 8/11
MNPEVLRRARPTIEQEFEKSEKVGEGTYGVVNRATDKKIRRTVAIKEFKETKEGEGISQTAIREIALLRELQHQNIVSLRSCYVDPQNRTLRLVYDYAEYDLFEITRHHRQQNQPLSDAMLLSVLYQLLCGVHFLHCNWIIHRDLKPSNVLVMGTVHNAPYEHGVVKIADFGLARSLLNPLRPMHTVVVTIWYRPPELLLGAKNYSAAVDMWAVGAILGELRTLYPMFPGQQKEKSNQFEDDQLRKIYELLGTPDLNRWPAAQRLQYWSTAAQWPRSPPQLDSFFRNYGFNSAKPLYDLMLKCLDFNPDTRIRAADALQHEYFTTAEAPPRLNIFDKPLTEGQPPYPVRKKKSATKE